MLTLAILFTYIIGLSTINALSFHFSRTEKLGLAFPIGIGIQTLLMLVIDFMGLPLNTTIISLASIFFMIGPVFLLYKRKEEGIACCKRLFKLDYKKYNLLWLFLIGIIAYFEYMNFAKCMYLPTFDRDSLAGFDTIGYVIAQEHTFHNLSLFNLDYMPHMHNAGSYISYIPMIQLSYAYVYLFGAATSKIIPALMYLSLILAFYGSLKRMIGHTGSAFITFLMMITPEMIAFSSLSATNAIHAVYASLGIIYIALWIKKREKKDLYMGSLLLALNLWTRMDGIAFIGAALLIVLIDSLRNKQFRNLVPVALTLLPALLWGIFSKVYGLTSESIAILHPFWDKEKANLICQNFYQLFTNTQYYGYTFAALVVSLLANSWFLFKKKNNIALLTMFITAALLYMTSLYQVNYIWDSINNVLAYSAKRFLFCFVPIAWYYAASNEWCQRLCKKLDSFLSLN